MSVKTWVDNNITPILLVISTAYTVWGAYNTSRIDTNTKSLTIIEKRQQMDREALSFDRDFKFRIFSEVKDAIKQKDVQLQEAVTIVITNMVQDTVFKIQLLSVLGASDKTSDSLKRNISKYINFIQADQNDKQKNEQAVVVSNKIRVDIFYAEETEATNNSKAKAENAKTILDANGYITRVRILPKLINASPGYKINENQIRFDDNEVDISNKILGLLTAGGYKDIKRLNSSQNTPNYLSVFFY